MFWVIGWLFYFYKRMIDFKIVMYLLNCYGLLNFFEKLYVICRIDYDLGDYK